ncbi:glycosyltransferase family 2 protein [Flavobacteriales bacterium]|jgi:glycosyltransferase involved in cell wall biosynthesis|nr:glycosyltransferase family 2 protein [Flavobacteriales bacterium]
MIQKLSIVIPVYNEQESIYPLLCKVNSLNLIYSIKKQIIIIDDCSTDSSKAEIERFIKSFSPLDVVFFSHTENQGKGSAIKTALEYASGEYIIIQDADLELNPEEINLLLVPVIDEVANVVYGSRFLKGGKREKEMFLNRLANKFFTWLSNLILRTSLTDMQTCYKLVPTEFLKSIDLVEKRFAFDPEITAKLAKNRSVIFQEVPISYEPRSVQEGKKIRWVDGFNQLFSIIKYGLFS